MGDTKFYIQLSFLILLNAIMLIILKFVSFDKKDIKHHEDKKNTMHSSKEFVLKLKEIDEKIQKVEPAKKVKPIKVVVVKEEVEQKPRIVYVTKYKKVKKKDKIEDTPSILISSQTIQKNSVVRRKDNIYKKLEKKFYKSYSYDIALKLSRLYYLQKNYEKALKWTKIANKLNRRDDKSWIMFAKIKIKQGNIKDAKRALNMYRNSYHSEEVEKLLKGIS